MDINHIACRTEVVLYQFGSIVQIQSSPCLELNYSDMVWHVLGNQSEIGDEFSVFPLDTRI